MMVLGLCDLFLLVRKNGFGSYLKFHFNHSTSLKHNNRVKKVKTLELNNRVWDEDSL